MADKKKDMVLMPDGRNLQSMKVAELKLELDKRGIPKAGSKKELIERLRGPLELEQLQRESQEGVAEIQPNKSMSKSLSNPFVELYLKQQEAILQQRESLREKGLSESESCDEPTEGLDSMDTPTNNSRVGSTPKNGGQLHHDDPSPDEEGDTETYNKYSNTQENDEREHTDRDHTKQNNTTTASDIDAAAAQDDGVKDPPSKTDTAQDDGVKDTADKVDVVQGDDEVKDPPPAEVKAAAEDDGIKEPPSQTDIPQDDGIKDTPVQDDGTKDPPAEVKAAAEDDGIKDTPTPIDETQDDEIKQCPAETDTAQDDGIKDPPAQPDCEGKVSDSTKNENTSDPVTPDQGSEEVAAPGKVRNEDNEAQFEPVYEEEEEPEGPGTEPPVATEDDNKHRRSRRRSSRRRSESKVAEPQVSSRRRLRRSNRTRSSSPPPPAETSRQSHSSDGELEEGEVEENTDTVPVIDITTQGFEIEDLGDSAKPQRTSRHSDRIRDAPSSTSTTSPHSTKKTDASLWVESQTAETKSSDRVEGTPPKETRKSERTRADHDPGAPRCSDDNASVPTPPSGKRISLTRKRDSMENKKEQSRRKVTIDDRTSPPEGDVAATSRVISLVRKEKVQPSPDDDEKVDTPDSEGVVKPTETESGNIEDSAGRTDHVDTASSSPTAPVEDKTRPVEDTAAVVVPTPEEKPPPPQRAPIVVKPRKISLRTNSDDVTGSGDKPTARKRRRWGTDSVHPSSQTSTTTTSSRAISTDTLRNLIRDVKAPRLRPMSREEGQLCSSSDSDVDVPSPSPSTPLQQRVTMTTVVTPDHEDKGERPQQQSTVTASVDDELTPEGEKVQGQDRSPSSADKPQTEEPMQVTEEPSIADDLTVEVVEKASNSNASLSDSTSPRKKRAVKEVDKPLIVKRPASLSTEEPAVQRRDPSPPRNEPTPIVHVTNLVRPFTLPQLKQLLSRHGTIDDPSFWIDKIKSHCFATYSTVDEATATRQALHGIKWPSSNPKFISMEFATQNELDVHRGLIPETPPSKTIADKSSPIKEKKVKPLLDDTTPTDGDWRAEREKRRQEREARRKAESAFLDKQNEDKLNRDKERQAERDAVRDKERAKRLKERQQRDQERKEKSEKLKKAKEEEAPAKLLDDLFRKTTAEPCIYWLPLTNEQIVTRAKEREEAQKKRVEERAAKDKEVEEARQKRLKEMEERNKRPAPVRRSSPPSPPSAMAATSGRRRRRSPTPPPAKKRSPAPSRGAPRRDTGKVGGEVTAGSRRRAPSSSSSSGNSSSSSSSGDDSNSSGGGGRSRKSPEVKRKKK